MYVRTDTHIDRRLREEREPKALSVAVGEAFTTPFSTRSLLCCYERAVCAYAYIYVCVCHRCGRHLGYICIGYCWLSWMHLHGGIAGYLG